MRFSKETLFSPPVVFIAYLVAAFFLIMGFRLVFPGEIAPLPIFSKDWRVIRGLLDFFALFPALAFSALVVSFGLVSIYSANSSQQLSQRLIIPFFMAISAAALYAVLFFMVLPLVEDREKNMRHKGEIYHLAKERAQIHASAGEWLEVSQFIGICDSVWEDSPEWKDNPELAKLRTELGVQLDEMFLKTQNQWGSSAKSVRELHNAIISSLPRQNEPVDAAEAIALGEAAFNEGRLFDAHWFATLGGRIAEIGSPEKATAAWLAARAWNQIETQQPTSIETQIYSVYQLKRSGYEAMISDDWIRAYYIFKELMGITPHDPDVEHFLAISERGTRGVAFFIDEMEVLLGETFTGTIYSLPYSPHGVHDQSEEGRSVMRVSSISASSDYAYGIGIEYMVFDSQSHLLLSLQAPYAKFLPITLNGHHEVLILMRTLDRHDPARRWEPELIIQDDTVYYPGTAQITLNISYETFLMLSEMRQELSSLQINRLLTAAEMAGETGYIPEVFQSEILNRLGTCLFFLPMAIITIAIGWYYRAKRHPRYISVLLLPVLPIVFNYVTYLYRTILNTVGISLTLAFGFSTALVVFIVILALAFFLSLLLLAAQAIKSH